MATCKENEDFGKCVLQTYPLDEAIDWIKKNFKPNEVFDDHDSLEEWIRNYYSPSDIFDDNILERYALEYIEDHGYIQPAE